MVEDSLKTVRRRYAREILRLADVRALRIEDVFATVPRDAFLGPPPWTLASRGVLWTTTDVAALYDDVLIVLDRERGINNGEPALHAAWLAAVDPEPGESVIHVGAGTGYYTAMLSLLVSPQGSVDAYECEPRLARDAARNLSSYANTRVHLESAYGRPLPPADVIYVNAGVTAPDIHWLRALKPQGRLIFPWQPHGGFGPAILVRPQGRGYAASRLMSVGFIRCSAAMPKEERRAGRGGHDSLAPHSIWLRSEREPDETAIAVFAEIWFSSSPAE